MGKFVKREEVQAADTPLKLAKLDVLETANHVVASEIDTRFSAIGNLAKAPEGKKLTQLQVLKSEKSLAQC